MKKLIAFGTIVFFGTYMNAQMNDVTVTVQPTASYNWFDSNVAIEDGLMLGGRIGFGFGEAIELRGVYERSIDLNNSIDGFDIFSDEFVENFNSRNVELERIGGEFKANIPTRGTFVPYLTIGAGVQRLNVDITAIDGASSELESEQIYANLGLGTQIKLSERFFLNLEAKNTVFNLNPGSLLFQDGQDQGEIEDLFGSGNNNQMYNWSVMAGLQLYLGGRSPEQFSRLDKAYYNKFSGGVSGFKLVVEPAGSYINFDSDSNLADSYFVGGKMGFDLNQYIGLRGYYYQATRNETISTDWDDMAMYGADFIAKLNVSRGLVPYLTVGGGYLNVYEDSYIGANGLTGASSGYFAKGGLGLSVPVGRNFELFGEASLLYTTERATSDLENIVDPDELRQHTMFTVGARIQLGKRANDTDDILQDEIDQRVETRTEEYQNRIDELESELSEAYKNNDTKKAVAIIEEKKSLERDNGKIDADTNKGSNASRVQMSPKELEDLIEKVLKGVDEESQKPQTIDQRMDRLEGLLLEINTGTYQQNAPSVRQKDASDKILDKLNELDNKIEKNNNQINNLDDALQARGQNQDKTVVISGAQQGVPIAPQMGTSTETRVTTDEYGNTTRTTDTGNNGLATGWVVKQGMSAFTGLAIADEVSMIVGIRGNYAFTNSPFVFMPDVYLAPGTNTGFGLNANVIIPFRVDAGVILEPYAGLGLGYNNAVGESTFSPNLVLGTTFNLLGGKLFADYTAHNFVDIHRISVGYKFNF